MKLEKKIAIVTGGGRGIGRAIAAAFAREGAHVVVTAAREKREIQAVASEIGGTAVLADVTRDDDVRRLVDGVVSDFGGIHILVNNAARGMKYVNASFMTDPKPFWEADPDVWRMVIDTNVTGVFRMTHAVVPHMLERGSGRIINISINQTTMERKGFSPYGPSKAALESMSIIWAKELEGTGLTLNVLLPGGATDTGMIPDNFPESRRSNLLDPAVMGPPAVYLASDEAADVNGQRIIAVDWHRRPSSSPV
ncbi:MAG: SDR family NAD(P)-dependent oxidoreductase [Gemmatimonadota bacterium]|jgi:NAD(P)-dependent dehydrogenase (short-subunit alcohol dehydrogenase family)